MRVGLADVYRAMRTPDGPATVHIRSIGYDIMAEAWGPARIGRSTPSRLIGALDDDTGFEPQHDVIGELWRRNRGVRITRSGAVMQALIPRSWSRR